VPFAQALAAFDPHHGIASDIAGSWSPLFTSGWPLSREGLRLCFAPAHWHVAAAPFTTPTDGSEQSSHSAVRQSKRLKKESETLPIDLLKAGDIVRLKVGSMEMMVSSILDTDTIECTYFDGKRQLTALVPVADVEKMRVPRDPNLPPPSN
jgi:uncharacterized protein YodC (DUF2158 family)